MPQRRLMTIGKSSKRSRARQAAHSGRQGINAAIRDSAPAFDAAQQRFSLGDFFEVPIAANSEWIRCQAAWLTSHPLQANKIGRGTDFSPLE